MAGLIEAKLAELGITLPKPMPPIATYVPYVISGNLVVISGQLPAVDGKVSLTGKLGGTVSVEQGQQAAQRCFINVLAHLKAAAAGDLDRVRRVVRLGGIHRLCARFLGPGTGDERRFGPRRRGVRGSRPARPDHHRCRGPATGCRG